MMLRQRHTGRQTRDELVGLLADSGGESRARGDAKKVCDFFDDLRKL